MEIGGVTPLSGDFVSFFLSDTGVWFIGYPDSYLVVFRRSATPRCPQPAPPFTTLACQAAPAGCAPAPVPALNVSWNPGPA